MNSPLTENQLKIRAIMEENNDNSRNYFKEQELKRKREKQIKLLKKIGIILLIVLIIGAGVYFAVYVAQAKGGGAGTGIIGEQACLDIGCPEGSIYAGSINSDKFYPCDCRYAKNINEENLVCFASAEEAISDGRVESEC